MSKTYEETLALMEDFANGTIQSNKLSNSDLSNIIASLEKQVLFEKQFEPEPEIYEGDDVICKEPWNCRIIDGYSGAFCECGHVLHIKTPRRKAFHPIKCPICGRIVNLFCGEIGETLCMDVVSSIVPVIDKLGD